VSLPGRALLRHDAGYVRSWMWMTLGAWLLASGGCNCIIDADQYRGGGGDGGGDDADGSDGSRPDGRIESDAGPIEPTAAREGEGTGTGAPPVMIVLRGAFAAGSTARVVRSGDDTDLVAEPAVVSTDGTMLAVGIRIPVDPDLDEGDDPATLEIYVDQGSGEELADTFLVEGLDEADLSGTVDTASLRPLYSRITTSASPVAFTGASPAILRSTSDITVAGDLVADGKQGGDPGPGGCPGGEATQAGGCDIHGGAGGASGTVGTGGGGGGHAQDGNPASGGGDGGQMSGNEMLTPLAGEGGNGGGGGGNGTADLGAGGGGGGGGGVVELSADGEIAVDGVIDVSGGAGSDGGGLCAAGGGSGGGGAGGAVLLRARSISGGGSLDATRGLKATACNDGGDGSPGRIRVDVASEALPALAAQPAPIRGPHWADDTPYLVREADFTATLYGEPNRTFAANVDGSEPVDVETNGSGVGTYSITLEPGHNRICAIVSPTALLSLAEASRCHIVTYLP
jgi:hypothetical protein